jgi:hypothetical protein
MRYQLAPIFCRPWLLNGLSQRLIESHYENNYGGALRTFRGGRTSWTAPFGANRMQDWAEELSRSDPLVVPLFIRESARSVWHWSREGVR